MTRLIPIALLLASCGGQVDDPVTLELTSGGLLVSGAYGEGVVSQEVPAQEHTAWKARSDGTLFVRAGDETTVGEMYVELTGEDLVVVERDGELLRPIAAWVTLGDEVVARETFE